FPGFTPSDTSDRHRTNFGAYLDAETELSTHVLADVAGRFEHYSDFGSRVTGKVALRYQPSKQFTLRGAASTGFRAPGISQEYFSKLVTNVIRGRPLEVIIAPVNDTIASLVGSNPLRAGTLVEVTRALPLREG